LDSSHPGACHLYIHAEEAHDPARAVACAERLAALMPGAGHLVHMPGHIYIRVGRYADAIEANRHAVHADEAYLEGPGVARRGLYPQGYYPHNYHFMSFAASMAGDSRTAIDAARRVAEKVGPEVAREIPWLEAVTPVVYWTLVTFGRWDEILAEPLPQAELRFATGQAYYARGVAYAAKAMWAEAGTALDSVAAIAANFAAGDNRKALEIAQHALAGEIALRRGDAAAAAGHFQAAVALEEALTYSEPPTWYYPMRQSLGKALLAAGRASEAERVYREDLRRFPENGWSLFGLAESLEAQAKTSEAQGVQQRFVTAWQGADVELVASRF
jgi:tetratricopeptide (TPR) repeat protein